MPYRMFVSTMLDHVDVTDNQDCPYFQQHTALDQYACAFFLLSRTRSDVNTLAGCPATPCDAADHANVAPLKERDT
jgi:hypothetical protein